MTAAANLNPDPLPAPVCGLCGRPDEHEGTTRLGPDQLRRRALAWRIEAARLDQRARWLEKQ